MTNLQKAQAAERAAEETAMSTEPDFRLVLSDNLPHRVECIHAVPMHAGCPKCGQATMSQRIAAMREVSAWRT